jgi:acetylserotonin N-methyltransferase
MAGDNVGTRANDDWGIWQAHLALAVFPAITVADEAGVFTVLAAEPASIDELAARTGLNQRVLRGVVGVLAAHGLVGQHCGRYHLEAAARRFLLPDSRYYWGPVLSFFREPRLTHAQLLAALRSPETASHWDVIEEDKGSKVWSLGTMPPAIAAEIAGYMNANSLTAAEFVARELDLSGARRLLDVGSGSGCFSIAFAQANPALECSLMDLEPMCEVAMKYVRHAGLQQRIRPIAVDMFRGDWPAGQDALFLSNVLHDWDARTAARLLAKAHAALPPGGRIHLHEMLLADALDGPEVAAAFSLYVSVTTKGQQYSAAELAAMLQAAGFSDPVVTPAYGAYAVVSATRSRG